MENISSLNIQPLEACELQHIKDFESFDLSSFRDAVVFFYAVWSLESQVAYNFLLEFLEKHKNEIKRSVYVIDLDQINHQFTEKHFGRILHAHGEFFLIKNGEIISMITIKTSKQHYKEDIFKLLTKE